MSRILLDNPASSTAHFAAMFLNSILDKQKQQIARIAAASTSKPEVLSRIVHEALEANVLPPARKGNTHEDGAKTIGLLIPKGMRARLEMQRHVWAIKNYKRTVFAALRVGLDVMERVAVQEAEAVDAASE